MEQNIQDYSKNKLEKNRNVKWEKNRIDHKRLS